jgi:hypothetical protein
MGKYYPESWEGLFAQKEQALRDNGCQEALDIASFDELQTSLHIIAQEYGDSGFPDIIARLQPSTILVRVWFGGYSKPSYR